MEEGTSGKVNTNEDVKMFPEVTATLPATTIPSTAVTSGAPASTSSGVKKDRRYGKPITEKWRPVYVWLESLKHKEVVKGSEISEWLERHPDVGKKLHASHTHEHVFNYIQKCHSRMLADPGRRSSLEHPRMEGSMKRENGLDSGAKEGNLRKTYKAGRGQSAALKIKRRKKKKARFTSYTTRRVVTDRRKQTIEHHSGPRSVRKRDYSQMSREEAVRTLELLGQLHKALAEQIEEDKLKKQTAGTRPDEPFERAKCVQSSKRIQDPVTSYAWSYSGAFPDVDVDLSNKEEKKERATPAARASESTSSNCRHKNLNIFRCLLERESGGNSETVAVRPLDVGTHGRRWTTHVQGWDALDNQFKGPIAWLQQQAYSSFRATWCAYTSSVALAPLERVDQGVQKVLDIRMHPGGLPQLVCSCNAAPNELLTYNLVNGRAKELVGHNCQIQAVEYAMDGERIISCGTNIVKVWDSSSGACLHTMGPGDTDGTPGHKKKISAMSVHHLQSCLVATSGGEGESELLLWNVRTGELASDLNAEMRQLRSNLPSMDAMKFCHESLLICGSDSADSQPAVVQIWDVDALKELMTFPANDSYITCLNTDPSGSTIITGAGDGTVGLFDLRTGGAISRLPLGISCEATSVAFSACGTFFHSSSTANHSLVWDTRMMPMDRGERPGERPIAVSKPNMWTARPLHCLSHGEPMPTTQNAGQLPGYVDEGDGGVNDARWCQSAPVLVTASGNGSIAMWDITLGRPCVRLLTSHTRCINTVAISRDDQFICSGGDDQKVVLYENRHGETTRGWRLTHPLCEELQPATMSD
ncbi:hypothetical protein MPTK1_3g04900 [Marchantia polymorpha subsp. ruderalis]|uniref:Anaphase-promoting complex subunit 4 WD40 domain-containing protein n=2 Tax=Marchantia polymorpha TaxID=3197 RepID=A0AAF6AXI5_MARPO|nr:hypothetical protein MARPO_0022s0039 [Marchantia polymorpha]BBN04469.1 hypothetical protein Mp_3g04900 [Marchantia polymorpha subsp. ruderalis]|eukprot:PTQ43934.1 hypothetical protein MARPO_0022s0039 [Marchantia polymorpha]